MKSISIKELHATTGKLVRRAGAGKAPILVTDHGKPVAVLAPLSSVKPKKPKKWTVLPEFAKLMATYKSTYDVMEDLDAIRGDR